MTKEELQELLTAVGGGTDPIGAEALTARQEAERNVGVKVLDTHWGLMFLGDAAHQFYMETLQEMATRMKDAEISQLHIVALHWHVASAARFAAAFNLLMRGYFGESVALARSLWEIALTFVAVRDGVATLEEVLGDDPDARVLPADEWEKRQRQIDSRIKKKLLWENATLTDEQRAAVQTFARMMNLATHKSKWGLTMNLARWNRGEAVPMLPTFDEQEAQAASNVLYLTTWALFATIPSLDVVLPAAHTPWHERYEKLMTAFKVVAVGPKATVQEFGAVVENVFVKH